MKSSCRRALAALSMLVLASCSAPQDPVSGDSAFDVYIDAVIADAIESGVDPGQIALLEESKVEGSVTVQATMEAITATFACLEDAGVNHFMQSEAQPESYTPPRYIFQDHSSGKTQLADDCIHRHSFFVEAAYQSQPEAGAARQAVFEQKLPQIIDCLQSQGESLADDATTDEILDFLNQPVEVWDEYIVNQRPMPHDCMALAGILVW